MGVAPRTLTPWLPTLPYCYSSLDIVNVNADWRTQQLNKAYILNILIYSNRKSCSKGAKKYTHRTYKHADTLIRKKKKNLLKIKKEFLFLRRPTFNILFVYLLLFLFHPHKRCFRRLGGHPTSSLLLQLECC